MSRILLIESLAILFFGSTVANGPPVLTQDLNKLALSEGAHVGDVVFQLIGSDPEGDPIKFGITGTESVEVDPVSGKMRVARPLDREMNDALHFVVTLEDVAEEGGEHNVVRIPVTAVILDKNDNAPAFKDVPYVIAVPEDTPVGSTVFRGIRVEDVDELGERLAVTCVDLPQRPDACSLLEVVTLNTTEQSYTGVLILRRALDYTRSQTYEMLLIASDGKHNTSTGLEVKITHVQNSPPVSLDSVTDVEHENSSTGSLVDGMNVAHSTEELPRNVTSELEPRMPGPSAAMSTAKKEVLISNDDHLPVFVPPTQRAEVTEDALPNTVFYTLKARDPDMNTSSALRFTLIEPITALDRKGMLVTDNTLFKTFFSVDHSTGEVSVANKLSRDVAAVVQLTVLFTDITSPTTRQGQDVLIINIIGINDNTLVFAEPWSPESPNFTVDLLEEQPVGTVVGTFAAADGDSEVAAYILEPEREYFEINNRTGTVRTRRRVDYEQVKSLNFTVMVCNSGEPQKSVSAEVTVNIINTNDMDPVFSQLSYTAELLENALAGTHVATVNAVDGDDGVFGTVTYSLVGEHSQDFSVAHNSGEITVKNTDLLDRERLPELTIQVMARDGAPQDTFRTATVPVRIKLLDVNDNAPHFHQHHYNITIKENLPVSPTSPIAQVQAEDPDEGDNGALRYSIISGNENHVFYLDPVMGILYPTTTLDEQPQEFHLVVEARDGMGSGIHADRATIVVRILDVNQHAPVFIMPAFNNATIEVPENYMPVNHETLIGLSVQPALIDHKIKSLNNRSNNCTCRLTLACNTFCTQQNAGIANYLVLTVKATDEDHGENGRVRYHFKVDNENVQETAEFTIDKDSGELRTKVALDRQVCNNYSLALVARDYSSPSPKETLQFLTICLVDTNNKQPEFPMDDFTLPYQFQVPENSHKDFFIGRVSVIDRKEGKHPSVFYHMLAGNEDGGFYLNKSDGSIFTNTSFDREMKEVYDLYIRASTEPTYYHSQEELTRLEEERDPSVAHVVVTILDENDNAPHFEQAIYYVGVNAMASTNTSIIKLSAEDPDRDINGSLEFSIASACLFKFGPMNTSCSSISSPFNVMEDGRIVTANYMTEYNQKHIVLDVVAKEVAPPGRETQTQIHVWIYEPQQLFRVILSRSPEEVNEERNEIVAELSNITQSLVVVDDIRYHVDSSGQIHRDWCDMYLHVVDPSTQTIGSVAEVLKAIDSKYDYLKDYYAGFAIENVVPAFVTIEEENFDTALTALVTLVIVLFIGSVTFIGVCCCLHFWVMPLPNYRKSRGLLLNKVDDLSNITDSPFWIEKKSNIYDEVEHSAAIFCQPEDYSQIQPRKDQMYDGTCGIDWASFQNTGQTLESSCFEPYHSKRASTINWD